MRITWLNLTVAVAGIASASTLMLREDAFATDMQLARIVTPVSNANTQRADETTPAPATATPTIGEETLRHLMATISPEEQVAANNGTRSDVAPKPTHKPSAKKHHGKKHAGKRHHASKKHSAHATYLAKAKPCKYHPASAQPAFLLHENAAATVTVTQKRAPWEVNTTRFGPNYGK